MPSLSEVWKHYATTTDHAHDIKHIREVVAIAKRLAERHGVDKKKAELAAILHDIGREVEQSIPSLDHAEVGANIARSFTSDPEILNAIRRHRKGSGERPVTMLDKILWDADLLAGAEHAEERAYKWNRDAGFKPEQAKLKADKYLRDEELKTYAPSNAYTPEVKEKLKEEVRSLKEKLASLEVTDKLRKKNRDIIMQTGAGVLRVPRVLSFSPLAKTFKNTLGLGANPEKQYVAYADPKGTLSGFMFNSSKDEETH